MPRLQRCTRRVLGCRVLFRLSSKYSGACHNCRWSDSSACRPQSGSQPTTRHATHNQGDELQGAACTVLPCDTQPAEVGCGGGVGGRRGARALPYRKLRGVRVQGLQCQSDSMSPGRLWKVECVQHAILNFNLKYLHFHAFFLQY